MKSLLLAFLLGAVSVPALAQSAARIDGVQMPAWRERDGNRVPLVPGMELRAGDRILSGKDARVLIRLSEGSVVKLGENGALRLAEVSATRELFKGALQVLEGAFRFTTDVAAKARKREVTVKVDQVTIGIRGTDFWGRARGERQVVCLIEGAIQVGADGEAAVTLDQPRQFYRRDKGRTEPVGLVEPQQLAEWAQETEIGAGKGALRRGGKFSVALFQSPQQREATAVRDRLRAAGYPAEVVSDKQAHIVRIRHLPTREEAQVLADSLEGRFGVKEPRVVQ